MAGAVNLRSDVYAFSKAEERDAEFIDQLIQIAEDRRTETLGTNYFEWEKEFYLFRPTFWQPQIEYQIKLRMPDLQFMFLNEASELTEQEPRFFISRQGQRRKEYEEAFKANWRANNCQLELFMATLWSLLCHTGFVEVVASPTPPRSVKIRARNPQNVYPDPFVNDWRDWEYVIVRVPMSPDEIARQFPEAAERLPMLLLEHQRELYIETRMGGVLGSGPMAIEMPPGAMQSVPIGRPPGASDYLSVDYVFIRDETREAVSREVAGSKDAGGVLPPPETMPKYPTGRLIVRTGKLKLWDGPNQYRRFPIIPIFALPPLYGAWGTPPVQYLIQLQHLAESMYSQVAENAIRMNYGYRLYQDGAILNPENMSKIGADLRVKTADDVRRAFAYIPAPGFSPQQTGMPMELLGHMRELFGLTQARQGQLGAGNVSPGLMDTAVTQAQAMTRMRARLLADAVEHLGRLTFETMVDFLDTTHLSYALDGTFHTAPWEGVPLHELADWDVKLDAASMRPMNQSTLKQLVPVLANLGLITPEYALTALGIPDAEEMAKKVEERQAMMAAMGAAQKRGGRK